jgi:hypothetical protein
MYFSNLLPGIAESVKNMAEVIANWWQPEIKNETQAIAQV